MNRIQYLTGSRKKGSKTIQSGLKAGAMETSSIGDMAFLLLIFFIVTSSFVMKQGLFLSLPSDSGQAIKVEESQIFEIAPLEELYLVGGPSGERLDEKQALQALIDKKAKIDDIVFVVHMDPAIAYERLIDALGIARQAGVKRISLKDKDQKG